MKYKLTADRIHEATKTVNLIVEFLQTRTLSTLRQADLWKLIKVVHPDDERVTYWRSRGKEKHGIPVEVSVLIYKDKRFKRTSIGSREVYLSLRGQS